MFRLLIAYLIIAGVASAGWVVTVECWVLCGLAWPLLVHIGAQMVALMRVWQMLYNFGWARGLAEAEAIGLAVQQRRRSRASSISAE
jgi:hypothetical protein